MGNAQFEIQAMEYLSGAMEPEAATAFEASLQDHPEFREQFEALQATWNGLELENIPEPSEAMDGQFYAFLEKEQQLQEAKEPKFNKGFQAFWASLWSPQWAFGLVLMVLGTGLGYYLGTQKTDPSPQTSVVAHSETESVRKELALTLLDQPWANQRLQGVGEVNKMGKVDQKVIEALLQTLMRDPNVNVRLAAIESLTKYAGDPKVREGLVQAIVHQDSPIVQVTLANLMVSLQEKKSIEPFKTLMRNKELDVAVKQKLEATIASLM